MESLLALRLRRLRLRHLEVLLAIESHGSLTATAEALEATQPAVSQWLAEIESALGVPLFLRGRQIQPTQFLAAAVRHARRIVTESHLLESELRAIAEGFFGRVRIGSMVVANANLIPRTLSNLRIHHQPPLQFVAVEDTATGLWQRFEQDELDLLVCRLDERAYMPGISCEVLFNDTHRVVAGPKHPLVKARRVSWANMSNAAWILPPPGTPLRRAIDATFIGAGLRTPTPWLETTALSLIQDLLQDRDSVAVLSNAAAARSVNLKIAATLPLQLASDVGPVGMVWKQSEPGPALKAVLAALRSEIQVSAFGRD